MNCQDAHKGGNNTIQREEGEEEKLSPNHNQNYQEPGRGQRIFWMRGGKRVLIQKDTFNGNYQKRAR